MAKGRYIKTCIWDNDWFGELEPNGKLVFLNTLTNDKTNMCGCYQTTIKKISDDTGVSRNEVREWMAKFEADGKMFFRDGWLYVNSFIEHQSLNPMVRQGIKNTLKNLPQWAKDRILIAYPELFTTKQESIDSLSDNFKHTTLNTNSKSQTQNSESASAGVRVPPVRVHVSDEEQDFTEQVFDGLRERFGTVQLRNESEWLHEIEQAWAARITPEHFLEVFDLLKKQKWRTGRITAKTVGDNLLELDRLRLEIAEQEGNGDSPRKDAAEAARSVGARNVTVI